MSIFLCPQNYLKLFILFTAYPIKLNTVTKILVICILPFYLTGYMCFIVWRIPYHETFIGFGTFHAYSMHECYSMHAILL